MILDLLPDDLSTCSIVDAGCGFGDFYNYLVKKQNLPQKYIGLDYLDEMCSIAEEKTAQEILHVDACKDTIPKADYFICSGALNTLSMFDTYLFIQNCYSTCSYGFIFNILYGDKKSDTYNYMNLKQIQKIAQDLGVKEVILKENYLENDITIGFFKEKK